MIKVRELTINDVESLISLLEQLWIGKQIDLTDVKRVIEKGLNNGYLVYICATDDEKLVGYCSSKIKSNLWMLANLGNVDELVVDSEYRNRGIGRMLMCEIEKIAREYECKRLELDSAFHRTIAHEFYERSGFEKRAYLFSKEI